MRDAAAADLLQSYEARNAALERLVIKQALELEFLKGLRVPHPGREAPPRPPSSAPRSVHRRSMPADDSYQFHAEPSPADDDTAVVEAIVKICDEFESYG